MAAVDLPSVIGDYRVVRLLGRGGMGAVYLAEDPVLARQVAIKVIDGLRGHAAARARFLVEARAVARLNHPNVVTVYRAGEHAGEPYLVSEFVDGVALDALTTRVTPARAAQLALALARGLAAAHQVGILHRDVKPGNVMLAADGTVKLLDFGLAKLAEPDGGLAPSAEAVAAPARPRRARAVDPAATQTFTPVAASAPARDSGGLTAAGSRLGTPRYMPPEAWRGEPLTAASDVYSLGLVVWELFAGRHPHAGLAVDELAAASGRVPSLAAAGVEVPPAIAALVDRSVAADPAARPATAGELVVALEAALADGGDGPAVDGPVAAGPASGRPSGATAAVLAGLGAAVLGGLGWIVWPDGPADRAVAPVAAVSAAAPPPVGGAGPQAPAPIRLTTAGGCADAPTFIDGSTLAYVWRHDGRSELMTVRPGGAPTSITRGLGQIELPTLGRHPGELVFVDERADGSSMIRAHDLTIGADADVVPGLAAATDYATLYYASAEHPTEVWARDGGAPRRLAALPPGHPVATLAMSPDHRHLIVLTGDDESEPGLCVVTTVDGAVRCPATDRLQQAAVGFSPDGGAVYYPAYAGVRRLDLASGDDRVVSEEYAVGGVAVSADGARLVRSSCRGWGSVAALAGDQLGVLIDLPYVTRPAPGPDGTVAVVTVRAGGGTRIVLWREGTPFATARDLVDGDGDLGAPSFTADGARLAYTVDSVRDGGGVRVAPVAGGAAVAWTTTSGDRDVRWLADGSLVFTRAGEVDQVRRVTQPGGPAQLLASDATIEDVARDGRVLIIRAERELAWIVPGTGAVTPIPVAGLDGGPVTAARLDPDGATAVVITEGERPVFYRVELATGQARPRFQLAPGDGLSTPGMLPDGRVAFRATARRGELFEERGQY